MLTIISEVDSAVWFAICGAFGVKLLELAELHKVPVIERPDLKDVFYWVPFFILPLLGGGLAQMYLSSHVQLSSVLAVNVGISAPLILRTMAQTNPFEKKVIYTPPSA